MKPIKVTAHLSNGYASTDPWSPSLENILAYWHLRNTLTDAEFAAGCGGVGELVIVDDLPIGIEKHREHWWYQCSSPLPEKVGEHITHFNRRFDQRQAEDFLWQKKQNRNLPLSSGALKNKRTKVAKLLAKRVSWHCMGDESQIMALLENCTHIGAQISRGYGEVLEWSVEPGNEKLARLYRPISVSFAEKHQVDGAKLEWGIRPNIRDPRNTIECILPTPLQAILPDQLLADLVGSTI